MRTTEFVQVVISDARIRRMFNRSELAADILRVLKTGNYYISEIARLCGSDPANVMMRIRGNGVRYRESMIELGLVFEYEDKHRSKYYGITAFGLEWYEKVNP